MKKIHSFTSTTTALVVLLVTALACPAATAQVPCITGTSVATATPLHPLGDWQYCITVAWGPLSHGLSHWDIILDLGACVCACNEFSYAAEDTAGTSDGEESCTVYYLSEYKCDDPSLDGVEGPLVKFDPFEDQDCEPDKSGSGTFCFYSNWPPVDISTPNGLGLVKFSTQSCTGQITGQLPACTCGTTATERDAWGRIKSIFR